MTSGDYSSEQPAVPPCALCSRVVLLVARAREKRDADDSGGYYATTLSDARGDSLDGGDPFSAGRVTFSPSKATNDQRLQDKPRALRQTAHGSRVRRRRKASQYVALITDVPACTRALLRQATPHAHLQGFYRSLLTDSNRRPSPYHGGFALLLCDVATALDKALLQFGRFLCLQRPSLGRP